MSYDEDQELIELLRAYLLDKTPENARRLRAALRSIGTTHRHAILGVLLESKPMRISQIAEEMGVPVSNIASTVANMLKGGELVRVGRGVYAVAGEAEDGESDSE